MAKAGYLTLHREGKLAERIAEAQQRLSPCMVCPRGCEGDRLSDEEGTELGDDSPSPSPPSSPQWGGSIPDNKHLFESVKQSPVSMVPKRSCMVIPS